MILILRLLVVAVLSLVLLTGCNPNIGVAQSRSEFVKQIKEGGLFRTKEQKIVKRPYNAVARDLREYADKCLDVQTVQKPNYQYQMAGGTTKYNPKVQSSGTVTYLSLQEQYGKPDNPSNKGTPPGGLIVLVAEVRPAGGGTQVDIYRTARGVVADFLFKWAEGDKESCPRLP
ncbi:MAG TPA: hypothetical protein VFR01_04755 [Geobacterales bacterium]|nr:hypothetical protein [Geobacterales bacterium]